MLEKHIPNIKLLEPNALAAPIIRTNSRLVEYLKAYPNSIDSKMSFPNGTPPAPDMGAVAPSPGGGPDAPKTTLWCVDGENMVEGRANNAAGWVSLSPGWMRTLSRVFSCRLRAKM